MADRELFSSEKALLGDLRNGVGYLLRKYADAKAEIKALKEERQRLLEEERQSSEKITDLEARIAFGGHGANASPAVLKLRDEVDALIREVDRCLEALEKSVK